MKLNMYAVGLLASLVLAGCDGNSESAGDITVNVEGDNIDNSVTNNNTEDNTAGQHANETGKVNEEKITERNMNNT